MFEWKYNPRRSDSVPNNAAGLKDGAAPTSEILKYESYAG